MTVSFSAMFRIVNLLQPYIRFHIFLTVSSDPSSTSFPCRSSSSMDSLPSLKCLKHSNLRDFDGVQSQNATLSIENISVMSSNFNANPMQTLLVLFIHLKIHITFINGHINLQFLYTYIIFIKFCN